MIDKLDLNTKAQELRELFGEDVNSPVDIFSLANQIDGLTIVYYPLGENISGMCVRSKRHRLAEQKLPRQEMEKYIFRLLEVFIRLFLCYSS